MRKFAEINFERCTPRECHETLGGCAAVDSCRHALLVQEGHDEPPMLLSATACVGCGDCAAACLVGAVRISSGL